METPEMLIHVNLFWVSLMRGARAGTWLARVGIGGLPRGGAQGDQVCGEQGYFNVGDRKTVGPLHLDFGGDEICLRLD